ncbi:MAG: hypothetical protein Q8941_06155 [Bacteroidota bacterium]|nr:hypothetical protein [Bacteroidota bacterium]
MKKFLALIFAGTAVMITGCETTHEISLNENNSGTMQTTTDLSGLIGMAKMSGQGKELEKAGDKAIDTTIMLDKAADSLKDITAEERALVKKGKLNFQMNIPAEKFIVKLQFPFSDPGEISRLEQLSSKLVQQALKKQLAESAKEGTDSGMMPGADDIPQSSVDDYYTTTYAKGMIQKKLNKEKYATVGNDEGMKALKEMAGMGLGNSTIIINLPRPAKKAEGKNLKLSDDKKKVMITNSVEDFFDDAPSLEFSIDY